MTRPACLPPRRRRRVPAAPARLPPAAALPFAPPVPLAPSALLAPLALFALLALAACASEPARSGSVSFDPAPAHGRRPAAAADAPPAGRAARAGADLPAGLETDVPVRALLDAHMEFLSSDELGGRETGTVHSEVTCRYVASAFRQAGLQPGGDDGGWLQHYPLQAQRVSLDGARLTVARQGETRELELLEDWVVSGYGGEDLDVRAGAAFAGYGIASEAAGIDDYADLDVTGRFALVLHGRPAGREDLRVAGNWRAKRAAAREAGAVGLVRLVVDEDSGAQRSIEFAKHRILSPSMDVPGDEPAEAWPVVTIYGRAAQELARSLGVPPPSEPSEPSEPDGSGTALPEARDLPGLEFALAARVETDRVEPSNVLGVIRGSDPDLLHEYVVVSAHNDHVGILPDGRVNNGADDNASGTSTIMVAAAVLAAGPQMRRSVLFLSVSGEEKGLLGSEWWCEHPTVPLQDVVANVNIDMVGRNDPAAVGATPSPEHPHYNTLVERAIALAPAAGMEVTWTAPKDGDDKVDNYYSRSDHYNFASRDIPVVFFFSGLHDDYHRPGDDLDKVLMDKLERMVALLVLVVRDTADADVRPHGLQSAGR